MYYGGEREQYPFGIPYAWGIPQKPREIIPPRDEFFLPPEEVPEPATFALFGLGFLLLLRRVKP